MAKLSLFLLLGVMACALEEAYSNNFFYYPNTQGAISYQYQPYSPYVYSAYAVPLDCDQSTTEGGGGEGKSSESSESSSSESSSSESTEGGSTEEASSESSSSSEESSEGGEGESSSSSSSSSEEEGGKKEEGSGEAKKEGSKKKAPKYVFPAPTYAFPPRTAQQVVYSAPASYPYMPYKTYSLIQQPTTYPIKSSGYNSYPYYSISNIPISGSYSAPVKSYISSPPVARIVSSPVSKIVSPAAYATNSFPAVSKTINFSPASGLGGPAGYWNGNLGYYRM